MTYDSVAKAAAKAKVKKKTNQLLKCAAQYCREKNIGARACCNLKAYESLGRHKLDSFLQKCNGEHDIEYTHSKLQILTDQERKELAMALNTYSANNRTQTKPEIQIHIMKLLEARRKLNKSLVSTKRINLNKAETVSIARGAVSDEWFTKFYSEYPDDIQKHAQCC